MNKNNSNKSYCILMSMITLVFWSVSFSSTAFLQHQDFNNQSFFLDSSVIYNGKSDNVIMEYTASSNNGRFFAAWVDDHNGKGHWKELHAASIDENGIILNSSEMFENLYPGVDLLNLKVLQNSYQYLLAWNYDSNSWPGRLRSRRMNFSGDFIDNRDIIITNDLNYQASVCEGDSVYLFAWNSGDKNTYITRLSKSGILLDHSPIPITSIDEICGFTEIIYKKPYFFVFVGSTSNIGILTVQRISEDGSIIDQKPLLLDSTITINLIKRGKNPNFTITPGDTACLIAWIDATDHSSPTNIYAFRMSYKGKRIDSENSKVNKDFTNKRSVSSVSVGSTFQVLWSTDSQIEGAKIEASGMIVPLQLKIQQPGAQVTFIKGDTSHLLLYGIKTPYEIFPRIYFQRLHPSGTLLDTTPVLLCASGNAQTNPAIAFNGNSYFIAWEDMRNTVSNIYGRRFDLKGVPLDSAALPLIISNEKCIAPQLTAGDQHYFLTWNNRLGALFSFDGTCITDTLSIIPHNRVTDLNIYYANSHYFCTWIDSYYLFLKSFTPEGTVKDTNAFKVYSMSQNCRSNLQTAIGKRNILSVFYDAPE